MCMMHEISNVKAVRLVEVLVTGKTALVETYVVVFSSYFCLCAARMLAPE